MYKVLAADDEALIRDGLRQIIRWDELGLELVNVVSGGEQALQYLQQCPVDILITDIRMGRMSGLELIERAKLLLPGLHCIILSGYNDFSYTKQAIRLGIDNYILKPVDEGELTQTLLEAITKLDAQADGQLQTEEHNILMQFILGRCLKGGIGAAALRDRAALLGFSVDAPETQAGLVRILGRTDEECTEKVRARLRQGSASLTGVQCYWYITEKGDTAFVLQGDLQLQQSAIRVFLQKAACSLSLLGIAVFSSLGPIVADALTLNTSFYRAQQLAELSMVMPAGSVADEHTAAKLHAGVEQGVNPDGHRLEEAILAGESEAVERYWDLWESSMHAQKNLTPDRIRKAAADLLFRMSILHGGTPRAEERFWDSSVYFQDLMQARTIPELREILARFSRERASQMRVVHDSRNPSVQRAVHIVEEKYVTNLTLRTLAETMHMNPVYLGQLFKSDTGFLFTAYLNRVRVAHAVALLRDTDDTLAVVAQKVGYASAGYFNNIFKKIYGIYPREYRMHPEQELREIASAD